MSAPSYSPPVVSAVSFEAAVADAFREEVEKDRKANGKPAPKMERELDILKGVVARLDEERRLHEQEAAVAAKLAKKTKRKAPATKFAGDEEFLAKMEANPAYTGLDIRRELGRAQAWASVRGVGVSQMRFVNWLNKAAANAPMLVNGQGQSSKPRSVAGNGIPEPANWKPWARDNLIDPSHADKNWSGFEPSVQRYISEQMSRQSRMTSREAASA